MAERWAFAGAVRWRLAAFVLGVGLLSTVGSQAAGSASAGSRAAASRGFVYARLLSHVRVDVTGRYVSRVETLTAMGGAAYYMADDPEHGNELWRSDGTPAGTTLVADIRPGASGSLPREMIAGDGTLYFVADDGVHGRELWRSGGTAATTYLLEDITPGAASSDPVPIGFADGLLVFAVHLDGETESPFALWVTDGTAAGTRALVGVPAARDAAAGLRLHGTAAAEDGKLLFAWSDGTRAGLWETDGSSTGTHALLPGVLPQLAGRIGSRLLVLGSDERRDEVSLWASDDSPAGFHLVRDVGRSVGGPTFKAIGALTTARGRVFFGAKPYGVIAPPLWVSDGTAAGTHLFRLPAQPQGRPAAAFLLADPVRPTAGRFYFFRVRSDRSRAESLWASDGTVVGTTRISPWFSTYTYPCVDVGFLGSQILFGATDACGVGTTDGLPSHTRFVPGAAGEPAAHRIQYPQNFLQLGPRLLFTATDIDSLDRQPQHRQPQLWAAQRSH